MVDLRFAAAVAGATGVGIGAFGAHALKATLEALPSGKGVDTFRTGNLFHLVHAAALLALSTSSADDTEKYQRPATLFITGICLFSGSLYGLALGGPRLLGPVTPLGGLCFIGGWISLAM